MAEGFLRSFDHELEVFSAGTFPATTIHPYAAKVMDEIEIDISSQFPKNVERYTSQPFDYVITVCDNARENCPVFWGAVRHRVHIGFDDPAMAVGSEEEVMSVFRRIRDEIHHRLYAFYEDVILRQ